MPLPFLLIAGAASAAIAGAAGAGYGAKKMKDANDIQKAAQACYDKKTKELEAANKRTLAVMDKLGETELEIIKSFATFQNYIESIQNRPEFSEIEGSDIEVPKYNPTEIKKASAGAAVLMGGLGGAALGTAGGFAAAGATTAAVMAFGTASTGTAIASLSGAAATNATLAALGGGAIAAGGGGMALGSLVLGGATLGVGILIGGIIFGITGKTLSSKAEEAVRQEKAAEKKIDEIIAFLGELEGYSKKYRDQLLTIDRIYQYHLNALGEMINLNGKTDWAEFTDKEKKITENCVLLVAVLFNMCKVKLVLAAEDGKALNKINREEVDNVMQSSHKALTAKGFVMPNI